MAEIQKDILLDEDFDLNIFNGDFRVGESWSQDVEIILGLAKGELKSDPILGVDLINFLNGKFSETQLKQVVKLNLDRDKKRTNKIEIIDSKIVIKP